MSRPFKHPKTGVYWLRKAVPASLRVVIGKRELVASLRTKDALQAKANAVPVLARFEALLADARSDGERLTQKGIAALCGEWYRREWDTWEDNPGDPDGWDMALELLADRFEDYEGPPDAYAEMALRVIPKKEDLQDAERLLQERGYLARPEDVWSARRWNCIAPWNAALAVTGDPTTRPKSSPRQSLGWPLRCPPRLLPEL